MHSRASRRSVVFRLLFTCSAVTAIAPGVAQFGGGKPQIPAQPVLSVYQQTISTEKLDIKPVAAGLGPIGPAMPAQLEETGINPALYQGTLAALQTYVRAIASVGPRPDIIPRIRFKLDPRPNAFAVSGEEIQLTTGMFKLIQENIQANPEAIQQLLFLLCHEYSHVLYDHPRLYGAKDKDVGIAKIAATAIKVASTVNDLSAKSGGSTVFDRRVMGTMQGTLALSPVIESEIYRVSFAPYHKEQESLADFAATDLMRKLQRGDARDAIGILTVYEQYDNSLVGQLKEGLKNLGSALKGSMEQMRAAAPALLAKNGPGAVLRQAENSVLKAIMNTLTGIIQRRLNRNTAHLYYSREKRGDAVKLYADKFFPRTAVAASAETTNAWASRFKVTAPIQLANTFDSEFGPDDAAQKARMLLLKQDGIGARATLDAAKAKFGAAAPTIAPSGGKKKGRKAAPSKAPAAPTPGIRSAFFHIVDAETYAFAGETANAVAAYLRATTLPEAQLRSFLDMAALQDLTGDGGGALVTLNRAGTRFGEQDVLLAKINHHLARNEMEAAKALLPACHSYPSITRQCDDAVAQRDDKDDDD